jgi:hypothetical protein
MGMIQQRTPANALLGLMLAMIMLLANAPATAATACKGLSQAQCTSASANCSWIKSYQTKSGSTVQAYCRAKPSKKNKATAAKSSSASKDKSSKSPSTTDKKSDKTTTDASPKKSTSSEKKSSTKKDDKKTKQDSTSSKSKKDAS